MTRQFQLPHIMKMVILILITAVFPMNTYANYMHTYQGNNFNDFDGYNNPYDTSMSVSGYFTTTDTLLSSTSYDFVSMPATGFTWSFYDGVQTADSASGGWGLTAFTVVTDTQGDIVEWYMNALKQDGEYDYWISTNCNPGPACGAGAHRDIGGWEHDPLYIVVGR